MSNVGRDDLLIVVGDPSSPDATVEASAETLEETIALMITNDSYEPDDISVWQGTRVEVRAKGFTIHNIDSLEAKRS